MSQQLTPDPSWHHMTSDDVTRCSSAGVCQYLSCSFLQLVVLVKQSGDGAAAVTGRTSGTQNKHTLSIIATCTHCSSQCLQVCWGVLRCVEVQTNSSWFTWRSSSVFLWPDWFSPAAESLKTENRISGADGRKLILVSTWSWLPVTGNYTCRVI